MNYVIDRFCGETKHTREFEWTLSQSFCYFLEKLKISWKKSAEGFPIRSQTEGKTPCVFG